MSNQISEEAPDKKKDGTEGSPEQSSEKKIRQAVYDIRYRARREELDVRHAFSQYVGNSGLSQQERSAVKDKLFGKDGGAGDQAESLAIESVSNAMFKVFESSEDTKYKIRVTDKEKGSSYVRYGDRKKITQLRGNPNISSVEMTGHGDPYEGDKSKKGEKTPNIKKSKGKDAEAKGKDHNIDLKKEAYEVTNADKKGNTPAYQGYKAGKKNVKTGEPLYKAADHLKKEEFIADAAAVAPPSSKKITGEKVDNRKLIKVYPQDKSDPQIGNIKSSKETDGPVILEIVRKLRKEDAEYGYDDEGKSLNPKDQKKESKKKEEEDPRSMATKWNLVKNKLRSMGLNCSNELEGETIEEADSLSAQTARWEANRQRRMKKSGSYERPNWIPRDQDHEDRYGSSKGEKKKPQKTHANLQNEEGELIDENRMAAYTAGAGEGSPASRPTVSKKTADRVSRSSDERAFGDRKKKEGIRLSPTKKYSGKDAGKTVKRANTTGRGTPTQYRKSHEDPDMGRYQQKVTQGSGSVKGLKKEHHQKDADGNTIPHEQINEVAPLIAAAGKVAVAGAKKAAVGAVKAKAKQVVTQKATQAAGAVADRVQKPIGAVESYKSESNVVRDILELNRFEKETGTSSGSLNMPKGKPTQKGGTSSPVMRAVRTSIRKETGKPAGQQKKVKGTKPPVAGEYGARKSPTQIVQKRRADKASADAAMSDTRGT